MDATTVLVWHEMVVCVGIDMALEAGRGRLGWVDATCWIGEIDSRRARVLERSRVDTQDCGHWRGSVDLREFMELEKRSSAAYCGR